MRFYFVLALVFFIVGCASAPAPTVAVSAPSPAPWNLEAASILKPHLCHTQWTDLDEALKNQPLHKSMNTKSELVSVYNFRMSLRHTLSSWTLQDPNLSVDCLLLFAQVQKRLLDIEQTLADGVFKNKKMQFIEQNVFMNSDEQLLSNPFLPDEVPVTSVSDLKSGDLVYATQAIEGKEFSSWSMIYKSETGSIFSLMPVSSTSWLRRSVHHPLSWLKQPMNRVVIFRPLNDEKVQRVLARVLPKAQQHDSFLHQQRSPASNVDAILGLFPSKAQLDPSLDPQFVQILQWQNHSK